MGVGQRFHMAKNRMQLNTAIYRLVRQNVAFRRPGNIFVQAGGAERLEFALNLNNLTDTEFLVPHMDYPQVYPGEPINVLATVRVH